MNLKPTAGKLIVQVDREEEVTAGGIVLPDTARDKANLGTVVAANEFEYYEDGVERWPEVLTGNRVLIGKYAGIEVVYDKQTYVVLHQRDILAVVESAPVAVGAANGNP